MKRLFYLSVMMLISFCSFSQIIKFQPGVSISNADLNLGLNDWKYNNKTLFGYSFFFGCDYLNNKYYNLSSNIGALKKGGDVTATSLTEPYRQLDLNLDYLSVNTTFELKYPLLNKITPFLSYGPRLDILLNDTRLINYNQFNYGLLMGGGLKYDINKLQFAIRTDYYLNFNVINKLNTHLFGKINDRTLTWNISIGYNYYNQLLSAFKFTDIKL